jgi:hypothetical protein
MVSARGTRAGVDVFLACFTWFDDTDGYCQVDMGLSLSQMLDRGEAWLRSGRLHPGVEIWLGMRRCVLLMGASGSDPEGVEVIGFPVERGVYRYDENRSGYVRLARRQGRQLAQGLGPA